MRIRVSDWRNLTKEEKMFLLEIAVEYNYFNFVRRVKGVRTIAG